jgi:hypothetical protein
MNSSGATAISRPQHNITTTASNGPDYFTSAPAIGRFWPDCVEKLLSGIEREILVRQRPDISNERLKVTALRNNNTRIGSLLGGHRLFQHNRPIAYLPSMRRIRLQITSKRMSDFGAHTRHRTYRRATAAYHPEPTSAQAPSAGKTRRHPTPLPPPSIALTKLRSGPLTRFSSLPGLPQPDPSSLSACL